MNYIIVTNNAFVRQKFDNVCFVEGSMENVLLKVRDMVHEGSELITHPLGASLRMMFSPYRSVVLQVSQGLPDCYHIETIENSIIMYRKHMQIRKEDVDNAKDYELIDHMLLQSALMEHDKFSQSL